MTAGVAQPGREKVLGLSNCGLAVALLRGADEKDGVNIYQGLE